MFHIPQDHMKDRVILIHIGGFYKFMKENACKSNLVGYKDKDPNSSIFSCVVWSHLYYSFEHRTNDKHDNVHFHQKLQYIHEGQLLR